MPPSNPATQPSTTTASSTTPTTPETSAPDRPEHREQLPEAETTSAPDNGQHPSSTTADDLAPPSTTLGTDGTAEEAQDPTSSEPPGQTTTNENVEANTNTMETDSPDSSTDSNAVTGPSTAGVEETHDEELQEEDEQDDEEHPYWAEIEEDTSAPDEEELKEIEAGQGDLSAYECMSTLFSSFLQSFSAHDSLFCR